MSIIWQNIEKIGIGIAFHLCNSMWKALSRISPVSYTHLDVYKRQIQHCTNCILVSDVSLVTIHSSQNSSSSQTYDFYSNWVQTRIGERAIKITAVENFTGS